MVGGFLTLLRTPLWRPFRRWSKDTRGVSAVEFALILPVMLMIYIGGNELGEALTINRKVTHVTSALGDLTTQAKTLTDCDITNIFNAASSILTPYSSSILKMRITALSIDNNSRAYVAWSRASGTGYTALTTNTEVTTVPANLKVANTFLVTAEAHYSWTPSIGYAVTGTYDLKDQFYLRPRQSTTIATPSSTCS